MPWLKGDWLGQLDGLATLYTLLDAKATSMPDRLIRKFLEVRPTESPGG
jgi:hypothetical protein